MSLPPLLRHVYNHGTEEVIRRGKRIFHTRGVQLLDVQQLEDRIRFRIRNDQYFNYYTVSIEHFSRPDQLSLRCQCPYNLGDICRHEVAALFQLNDMVQSGFFNDAAVTYNQEHTVVRMQQVNEELMAMYVAPEALAQAAEWARENKATLEPAVGDTLKASVEEDGKIFPVTIQQNEARYFHTSCICDEDKHPLCVHKATVFLQAGRQFGNQFFSRLQNYDVHKNKLLAQYGYSLKDDLSGKFEFFYQEEKPFLRVLDASIKKVNAAPAPVKETAAEKQPEAPVQPKRIGLVVSPGDPFYPNVALQLIAAQEDGEGKKLLPPLSLVELAQYVDVAQFAAQDQQLLPLARKFLPAELWKYLRKNLAFGEYLDDYENHLSGTPEDSIKTQVWDYLLPKWKQLAAQYAGHPFVYLLPEKKQLNSTQIKPLQLSTSGFSVAVHFANGKGKAMAAQLRMEVEGNDYALSDVSLLNEGLLLLDDVLYMAESTTVTEVLSVFSSKDTLAVKGTAWPAFLKEKALDWYRKVTVTFAPSLLETHDPQPPRLRIYLQERDQQLVLQPAFVYNDAEVRWGLTGDLALAEGARVRLVARDAEAEAALLREIKLLHSDMRQNERQHFFHLPASEVLSGNWFFHFMDAMRERSVEVLGHENLRQLRVSPHRPQTMLRVSSGIDWFDAQLDLVYGDQQVSITEVKKALAAKQQYVPLADGTLGLLPDEWLKKYSLLVKVGEGGHGNALRLKKTQFSVLDDLLSAVDETQLAAELEEKKERLAAIGAEQFKELPPPEGLKAELRPYQQAGFQWLAFLKETGWGGILADDMGLGKTVQTLAFFQHYFNENPDAHFLVVCPTTLAFNWEAEARRFTPELSVHIHHGPKRVTGPEIFLSRNISITTYGTMRSDVLLLKSIHFDYVVLDESQAIKNPQSQVAKASLLLHAKNKLALSGTPVQNNTFDLYSQLNFLNPGMLGSREFFQNEFATPIDKFGEEEVRDQLKQLTHPFILRRSKEQVAKDLPEKTEAVLLCEMGKEQRRIYDAYRNDYRAELLGMIDSRGMQQSQFHVLQGLTKLRQICDSPAILNETEKYPNHSVKLEELVREISENVGNHKALIFSQFLGMLALIRQAVIKAGIDFAYFDGSASTMQRETAIRKFQGNEDCRVFLISLKAGGVGLNLTAADYVYIVDPWWNPAVEQQAIDRTHRIGQTKNIVAYRMICKDTIEEKILLLQERKRLLASGLIADDNALLKKLTREDVAFLLS